MSIFSRVKKAKKAADEHKKATEKVEEAKPPPAPYKHVPKHAAQDALAATPTTWSPEETRARIAAARRRRSEATLSTVHSRQNSATLLPRTHMARSQSDMSLASTVEAEHWRSYQLKSVYTPPSVASLSHAQPKISIRQNPLQNQPAIFANPRDVPQPPALKKRPYYGSHANSSSSMGVAKRKSPLSTVSTEEEPDEVNYQSSQSCSRASSQTSSVNNALSSAPASAAPSAPSSPKLRSLSSPRSSMPKFSHASKHKPAVDISLPYNSVDESSTAAGAVPSWRYSDFTFPESQPVMEPTTHSRKSSFGLGFFHRTKSSMSTIAAA